MTAPVDVLSVLRELRETHVRANGAVMSDHDGSLARIDASIAAVAELIKCCEVTVKAFEALGRTDNIVAQLESHREYERALVEQKAALARVQGGAA